MSYSTSSRAERRAAACARLLLLCTVLLMLTGLCAVILGVPLPAWERPAVLLDSLGVGFYALLRFLCVPRPVRRYGGGR
jgi:hypothetical protein